MVFHCSILVFPLAMHARCEIVMEFVRMCTGI